MAQKKIVVVITHGPDNPEKATIGYTMATAALTMDAQVTVALQAAGVYTATKGVYEHIHAPGLQPLHKLVDQFMEMGGRMYVCIPCIEERAIPKEKLVDGAELVKAGKLITEVLNADGVLNY